MPYIPGYQRYKLVDPVSQYERIKDISRMMECRQFYQLYISNNKDYEQKYLNSFAVSIKFCMDYLLDLDICDQELHRCVTTDNILRVVDDGTFIEFSYFRPKTTDPLDLDVDTIRFHYSCTFSNILIQLIDHLFYQSIKN